MNPNKKLTLAKVFKSVIRDLDSQELLFENPEKKYLEEPDSEGFYIITIPYKTIITEEYDELKPIDQMKGIINTPEGCISFIFTRSDNNQQMIISAIKDIDDKHNTELKEAVMLTLVEQNKSDDDVDEINKLYMGKSENPDIKRIADEILYSPINIFAKYKKNTHLKEYESLKNSPLNS